MTRAEYARDGGPIALRGQLCLNTCYADRRPVGGAGGRQNAFGSQGRCDSVKGLSAFCFDLRQDWPQRRSVRSGLGRARRRALGEIRDPFHPVKLPSLSQFFNAEAVARASRSGN
jgi:hypothetical protein